VIAITSPLRAAIAPAVIDEALVDRARIEAAEEGQKVRGD